MSSIQKTDKKNLNSRYFVNAAIVVAIMVFFRYLPPFGAMTPLGMTITGIFLGALWGWINCDLVWPSALAFVFLGFTGYVKNVPEGITSAMSNPNVQLILWLLIFASILVVSGISELLANRFMASKLIKGRPWLLSIVIFAVAYLCSLFGAAMASLFVCWDFVYSISKQAGYTRKDKWPKMMLVGVAFSGGIGLVVLPFQVGVAASYGYLASASNGLFATYNFMQYLVFALIFGLVIMGIYILLCVFVVRPDMSKLKADIDVGEKISLNTKHKLAIGALLAILILTILPSVLPNGAAKKFFNTIGTSAIVLLICVGVTLFRDKNGKHYFTFQELASKGVYWGVMFMVATAIVLGMALSSPDSGFNKTFVDLFQPMIAGTSAYTFALIVFIATIVLTNIINNSVAGAIMVPMMYSVSTIAHANPLMVTALIVVASNIGLILPSASPKAALMAGNKEWLTQKDIFLQSLVGILATIIAVAIVGIPLGNAIFK